MKRKVFVVLLLLILSIVGGCSKNDSKNTDSKSKTEEAQGPVEIVIWHDKEEAVTKILQDALDELAPEIVVSLERKADLTEKLKLVGNDSDTAPDLYFFAHDKIGVYAEMEILEPITELLPSDTLDNFMKTTLEAASYNGALYQLPIYYETLLFMYNKDLMSEEDVPKTTEELYQHMVERTKDGHYGFLEQHSTSYYSVPWLHGFGSDLIDENGKSLLDSQATIDALTYHKKFVEYMPGESEYSTVNTLFLEGCADSVIGGPWLVPSVREANIDLGFSTMPVVDETGLPLAPYIGVQGIHVLKVAAQSKAEAITKVLEKIADPQLGIQMAYISGCAPANKICYEDPAILEDEMIMAMEKTAETAIPTPNRPEMDIMLVVAGNLLVDINMKNAAIEEAAHKYQSKAEVLIEAMK